MHRYRRQQVKNMLDFVGMSVLIYKIQGHTLQILFFSFSVATGGIFSLFMGASILSLLELIYFFTVRQLGNLWLTRHER